jgi:hypothetical protein
MDLTTLLIEIVIFLAIVAVVIAVARAVRVHPARVRLTDLPPETRSRYVSSWQRVEKVFIDAPEAAVTEADAVVMALLGERGHPMGEARLPHRVVTARRKLAEGRKRHLTEDLRRALLDYRAVFGQMIGPEIPQAMPEDRREMA